MQVTVCRRHDPTKTIPGRGRIRLKRWSNWFAPTAAATIIHNKIVNALVYYKLIRIEIGTLQVYTYTHTFTQYRHTGHRHSPGYNGIVFKTKYDGCHKNQPSFLVRNVHVTTLVFLIYRFLSQWKTILNR